MHVSALTLCAIVCRPAWHSLERPPLNKGKEFSHRHVAAVCTKVLMTIVCRANKTQHLTVIDFMS